LAFKKTHPPGFGNVHPSNSPPIVELNNVRGVAQHKTLKTSLGNVLLFFDLFLHNNGMVKKVANGPPSVCHMYT